MSQIIPDAGAEPCNANKAPKTAKDIACAVKHYTDQDPTLHPEAAAYILTPDRRCTRLLRKSFEVVRASMNE